MKKYLNLLLKSLIPVAEDEKERVLKDIEIERRWFENIPPYETIESIMADVGVGKLKQVKGDSNYSPIMRLRNPKLVSDYPPFLTTKAKETLDKIGMLWREEMDKNFLDKDIKFAVTSLIRTTEYQKKLVEAGKLADPESVHCKGEAFDIDASGYYKSDIPINPRTNLQDEFAQTFDEMGAIIEAPRFGDYKEYNQLLIDLLEKVLTELKERGKIHYVHEFPGTGNDVFHVCRNPQKEL